MWGNCRLVHVRMDDDEEILSFDNVRVSPHQRFLLARIPGWELTATDAVQRSGRPGVHESIPKYSRFGCLRRMKICLVRYGATEARDERASVVSLGAADSLDELYNSGRMFCAHSIGGDSDMPSSESKRLRVGGIVHPCPHICIDLDEGGYIIRRIDDFVPPIALEPAKRWARSRTRRSRADEQLQRQLARAPRATTHSSADSQD